MSPLLFTRYHPGISKALQFSKLIFHLMKQVSNSSGASSSQPSFFKHIFGIMTLGSNIRGAETLKGSKIELV